MSELNYRLNLQDSASGPAKNIASALSTIPPVFKQINDIAAKIDIGKQLNASVAKLHIDKQRFKSQFDGLANIGSSAALSKISAQFTKYTPSLFAKLTQGIGNTFGEKGVSTFLNAAKGLGNIDSKLQSVGMSLGGVVAGGAMAAAAAIAVVVAGLGAAVAGAMKLGATLAKAFTKQTIETGMFRENSLIGLEVALKSKEKALAVYNKAVKLASNTPFETTDVVPMFQKLLNAGFKENELERVGTLMSDLAAGNGGDKEKMTQMVLLLSRIRNTGKLQGDELNEAAAAGVDANDVKARLAKKFNKTKEQIEKMQSAGQISADDAIEAILASISDKFGGTSDKLSKGFSGLWSTLSSRTTELFNAALKDKNGGMAQYYGQIKQAIKWLGDLLDPDKETGKKLVDFLNTVGTVFAGVGQILNGAAKGFGEGFMNVFPDTEKFKGLDVSAIAKAFEYLGLAIGYTVGGMVWLGTWAASNSTLLKTVAVAAVIVGVSIMAIGAALALAAAPLWAIPVAIGVVLALIGAAAFETALRIVRIGEALWDVPGKILKIIGECFAAAASIGQAITDGIASTLKPNIAGPIQQELASLPSNIGVISPVLGVAQKMANPNAEMGVKPAPSSEFGISTNVSTPNIPFPNVPITTTASNSGSNSGSGKDPTNSYSADNSKTIVFNNVFNVESNGKSESDLQDAFDTFLARMKLQLGTA